MRARGWAVLVGCGALLLGLGAWKGPLEINKDFTTPGLHLVSLAADGTPLSVQPAGTSAVSGDSRFVAFQQFGGLNPLFVRDTRTGSVVWVCPEEGALDYVSCSNPLLSHDGRFIAFNSKAEHLAPGDRPDKRDVFVKDLSTGAVRVVSRGAKVAGGRDAFLGSMSADASRIAFTTGESNPQIRVWVADETGRVRLVGDRPSSGPQLSADGNTVVFSSFRYKSKGTAVDGERGGVFIRDLRTGRLSSLIDVVRLRLPRGHVIGGYSAPSADGSRLAFSVYTVLDTGLKASGLYVADLRTGDVLHRVTAPDGRLAAATAPQLSADGQHLMFASRDDDLAPGADRDGEDLFVTDLQTRRTRMVTPKVFGSWSYEPQAISADGAVLFESGLLEVPERAPERDPQSFYGTYLARTEPEF